MRLSFAALAAATLSGLAAPVTAQDVSDPARLAGVQGVAVRTSAVWDEMITTSAGGATEAQFEEALLMGLRDAIDSAERGPQLDDDAGAFLLCHVDTFYESGLIVYSVRVSYHEPGPGDRPAITWLRSWVGSYTAQQLHVIWTLADQCADAFLEDWRSVNGG
jgi:hypothetical protein